MATRREGSAERHPNQNSQRGNLDSGAQMTILNILDWQYTLAATMTIQATCLGHCAWLAYRDDIRRKFRRRK